jgi:two-component system sensor histidine kinase RegB
LKASLPVLPMFALLAVVAASNLVASRVQWLTSTQRTGALVLLDVAILTGLLALSGGPANPFSVLFLVHVMLAAIITTRAWTWIIIATSSAGFALLFVLRVPLPPELGGHAHHMTDEAYSIHLQGMWLAYTVAATAIGVFVSGLAAALRRERERQEQTSRLLGLAALAAGAAHEIGNPLGTIRIAAGELEQDLLSREGPSELLSDVQLINQEVARARVVLDRMASAAGELAGEAILPLDAEGILAGAVTLVGEEGSRVRLDVDGALPKVCWPREATKQAISQIVRNALDASGPDGEVAVRASVDGEGVALEIQDRGVGMAPPVLARVGEPFFTTRPGRGMGLGAFVARSLIERMGGHISLDARLGKGTTVFVWLPFGVTA